MTADGKAKRFRLPSAVIDRRYIGDAASRHRQPADYTFPATSVRRRQYQMILPSSWPSLKSSRTEPRRLCDHLEHLLAVLRRRVGHVEVPVDVGHLERLDLHLRHGQAGIDAPLAQLVGRDVAGMAGVAQLFELVHPRVRLDVIVGHGGVDDDKVAVGFQHAGRFAHELLGRAEVVHRHAAGDEAEAVVGIGQLLRGMLLEIDLEVLLRGELLRLLEHAGGDVGRGDGVSLFREVHRGMAVARRDVERRRGGAQLQLDHGRIDVGGVGEDVRLAVLVSALVELALRGELCVVEQLAEIARAHLRIPGLQHEAVFGQRGVAGEKGNCRSRRKARSRRRRAGRRSGTASCSGSSRTAGCSGETPRRAN